MLRIAAVALVFFSSGVTSQTVFRCEGPNGQTIFSQQACPDGSVGGKLSVRNDPPSGGSDYVPWADTTRSSEQAKHQLKDRAAVTVVGGGNGCSAVSDQTVRTAIVKKQIFPGMTTDQAIRSWGKPVKINRSSHGADQWVYPGHQYLYVEDGCVTSWN
ncbi:DUF4124 domain-containing protein [Pseudomonas sp. gcc21]|uniref:DUF4124 domain-containing protein n=1 Tax=Pseudomonas sp. gcc21 TaxID=2726989 RepID=UPI00145229D4|nr:DUF4124 domain-containing protein [Pseudomonas sp. gcc21]